ncbi:MAG: phenylacetate--CoA ligase [Alphaproteobacteria bacterium]|nr:MAG: phenylacetate--CoA ligase [Alphaproteobacteria bacterium]
MLDHRRPAEVLSRLDAFLKTPLDSLLARAPEGHAETEAVAFFHEAAQSVPAYGAFLKAQGIDPAGIRTIQDFRRLPLVTKENYLRKYPLPALTRGGRLEACDMVAVSSGSTGEPGFWPRALTDELAVAARFEQVFHDSFAADTKPTLAIVCFALGTWVGGMFTAACCRHLAAKGYPVTVVTPGSNRDEILRVVRDLAPQFAQTVLLGYPPFLKDVIDHGNAAGIDWAARDMGLVTAGEVFSEEWRELVCARAGIGDPRYRTASLYGTADAGVLGNETPLSIAIRRQLARQPELARALFGEARLPTLVQYDPLARFFEMVDGTLVFSGRSGVPLLRYHIADTGGIIGYDEMLHRLAETGFDPVRTLARSDWRGVRELPFVYVFGRTQFAVSFFGANVFPETVAIGLEQPEIAPQVTGKFVLQAREGLDEAPHLALAVELAPGKQAADISPEAIAEAVLAQLLRLNSEFKAYTPAEFQRPRVTLHPAGDPEWFPPGVKHRYTRR